MTDSTGANSYWLMKNENLHLTESKDHTSSKSTTVDMPPKATPTRP